MGHIQDRWYRQARHPETGRLLFNDKDKPVMERSELYGVGLRYKVRYLDPDNNERSKSFADKQKKRAENFLIEVESDKREGKYVDPQAGRVLFAVVADRWVAAQTFDHTTRERVISRLANHLKPFFKAKTIGAVKPSDVQAWLRWLQDREVSTRSRVLYFTHLVSILSFAKEDKLIVSNPAQASSVTRPRADLRQVQPWRPERAQAVLNALPVRFKPVVRVPAGIGLRQGEVFGFSLDDVDRERNVAQVDRQVRIVDNILCFAPPKRGKTREVPIVVSCCPPWTSTPSSSRRPRSRSRGSTPRASRSP
jgi:integrase